MVDVTDWTWLLLCAIPDRGFQKALLRPEFSRIGPNGQRQVNLFWLFAWAYSDSGGSFRCSATALAIRNAWPDHAWFNVRVFLQVARLRRYKFP
jgi:hypothetical protein